MLRQYSSSEVWNLGYMYRQSPTFSLRWLHRLSLLILMVGSWQGLSLLSLELFWLTCRKLQKAFKHTPFVRWLVSPKELKTTWRYLQYLLVTEDECIEFYSTLDDCITHGMKMIKMRGNTPKETTTTDMCIPWYWS